MKESKLNRKFKDISDLARTYDRIIVDTSVLQSSNAQAITQTDYQMGLRSSAQKYQNIFTIDEVFTESRLIGVKQPQSFGIQKMTVGRYEPSFTRFYDFLKPSAMKAGIFDTEADSLQTDLKLATLVFTLSAADSQIVTFLSSDRALLDYINSNNGRIRSSTQRVPALRGKIKIFTLIQKTGSFLPYSEEKGLRNGRANW